MNYTKQLLDYISNSPSPFHVVEYSSSMLKDAGFKELDPSQNWSLEPNAGYYINQYGTTLLAFTTGKTIDEMSSVRMANAHTDQPCFRVKPNPILLEKGYLKVNTETYGGVILNTWLDRPLSLAGKVVLKSDDVFNPKTTLIDFARPLLTIPNLAIHLNRDINKGVELNKQTHMLPILGMINDTLNNDDYFLNIIAEELHVKPEEIIDFDLYVYLYENGTTLGINNEFISSPRLDNLTSSLALINGLIASKNNENSNINIIGLFDNEEVGSSTKQGADSMVSNILLTKIFAGLGKSQVDAYNIIPKSFCISMDVAHALHPNYSAKSDPTNIAVLNGGVVLKIDTTQRYASDIEALATIEQLCKNNNIVYQKYVNRSDALGGSTLGSISSTWLPMKTVDLGMPMLAMHSARELIGVKDQEMLVKLAEAYFTK